ncbi:galectin-5-like isoform X2 [Boleophthalmus pectinirostris]|uniref:galectin-5-like isoform X2 n=1 Tax=Boleophthalmus pectinirostris TaxID=150288 RepID=UPI000A1C4671|nr:galectin-5-like isoform X2 [Boleophthalmus pectinirostris]
MNLSDALGDWPGGNQSGGGGAWPGQNNNPTWPAGQPTNPTWPGGQPTNPTWPGGPSQPSAPGGWPSAPSQPAQPSGPGWPSGPSQPTNPSWPSGPSQPTNPSWPSGPAPAPAPSPSFPVAPQQNLSVPFQKDFPSGLYDKMLITIAGTVKNNPNKFIIDFYAGSELVFHFNPRFNENGRQVIVRNSEIGKKWGKEERDLPHFPFRSGQGFEIKIMVTNHSFKVAVNGSHLLEFKHRYSNLRAINRMMLYHDVTLSKFNVENLP